eukprot:jgi/Tetstr1/433933/TSEL_023110.t1
MEARLAECVGAPWQTSSPGQKWAASLVVSRVRAAGIEEDEKDMRKRVTRGRPDAKVRKFMAASSTAQPPGVVKTLTDDKKRKRPVKKRRGALGEVVAPEWAVGLVVSRVRAAGIEEDEKDMRKRVTRGHPDAKTRKLMAASSTAQPPGVVKTLTAAVLPPDAPLPRPPLTEKELCWMNAADKKQSDADKKRKRPVKKRRGEKLTVAESEAESESESEAEAARSSKRRVPRARKNKQ